MILEDYERIACQAVINARKAKTVAGMLWNVQIYQKAMQRIVALRAAGPFAGVVVPRFLPAEDLT